MESYVKIVLLNSCVYRVLLEHEIQVNHPELSSLSKIAISNRHLECFKLRKEIFYSNVNSWRVVITISTNICQCFRNFVSCFSEKPLIELKRNKCKGILLSVEALLRIQRFSAKTTAFSVV